MFLVGPLNTPGKKRTHRENPQKFGGEGGESQKGQNKDKCQGKTYWVAPALLTVLVFWSWVLLLPRLPPWSRSLRLFPWASILLYGPLDIAARSSPTTRAKTGRTAHVFTAQGGTRRKWGQTSRNRETHRLKPRLPALAICFRQYMS